MAQPKPPDTKRETLRQNGTLNPHPEAVVDPLFATSDFFDTRDIVQVKYEMVRRVRIDGEPVTGSAAAFGFSRPSFYQAQAALDHGGLSALVPQRPGPRRSHKLGTEVVDFLEVERSRNMSLTSKDLSRRVQEHFKLEVHPRSVERALARRKKKRG